MSVQEGGKIIGQGTYGCVFSPPLLCRNREAIATGRLGKLSDVVDIKRELQAAVDLKGVSPFFVLPETNTLCAPAPMNKQTEPDIEKCEALKRIDTKNMLQYEMRFGGQAVKIVSVNPNMKFSFLKFMDELLQVGALLLVNKYVHGDFHMSNVLIDKGSVRLIDFGRSFSADRLTQNIIDEGWTAYGPSHAYESPDMSLIIAVQEKVQLEVCMRDIHDTKSSVINLERVLGVSRNEQMLELLQFWNASKAAQNDNWLTYWKTYWPSYDAWAIGAILIEVLRTRLLSQEFVADVWNQHQEIIEGIIKGLLHSSPKKRLDCLEALALFNPMHPLVTGVGAKWLKAKRTEAKRTEAKRTEAQR